MSAASATGPHETAPLSPPPRSNKRHCAFYDQDNRGTVTGPSERGKSNETGKPASLPNRTRLAEQTRKPKLNRTGYDGFSDWKN